MEPQDSYVGDGARVGQIGVPLRGKKGPLKGVRGEYIRMCSYVLMFVTFAQTTNEAHVKIWTYGTLNYWLCYYVFFSWTYTTLSIWRRVFLIQHIEHKCCLVLLIMCLGKNCFVHMVVTHIKTKENQNADVPFEQFKRLNMCCKQQSKRWNYDITDLCAFFVFNNDKWHVVFFEFLKFELLHFWNCEFMCF